MNAPVRFGRKGRYHHVGETWRDTERAARFGGVYVPENHSWPDDDAHPAGAAAIVFGIFGLTAGLSGVASLVWLASAFVGGR